MIEALDHVQIAAPPGCEAAARWFFGRLLGLTEIEKPPALRPRGGVWFRVGRQELHVGVDPAFAPARKAHAALMVQTGALAEHARRLAGAGIEPTWDTEGAGISRFYVDDPWGNRLELVERARS
jgi:catechol 2,3-dioxygenase-like lactoylglutathione lyase family enzyme